MTATRSSVAAAQVDGPAVRVYGRAGSFGALASATQSPSGDRLAAVPVRGWGFMPGQSAYFPAVAPDGTVVIAGEPQTDDQLQPTSRQMVLSTFSPTTGRFANVVIPTSTGKTTLGGPWTGPELLTGGGDIADVGVIQGPRGPQVTFLSAMPFWGWDAARGGEFPTLGALRPAGPGRWLPDPARSVTASQIAARTARSAGAHRAAGTSRRRVRRNPDAACTLRSYPATGSFGDCHMPAEFEQLPRSGALVVTQYAFDDPARPSGRISVVSTTGRSLASLAYPTVRSADGAVVRVHPREVVTDPLGRPGDERFVVIFDVEADQGRLGTSASPGVFQEFRYDAATATISATSAPVRTGDRWGEQTLGAETAKYSSDGALWLGQSVIGTLQAGPLVRYRRTPGSAGVLGARPGCGVGASAASNWASVCPPDDRIGEAAALGIARSLDDDTDRGRMLLTTMSGFVLPIDPGGPDGRPVAGRPVDLGLDRLADRTSVRIGPRKAALDAARSSLWVPIQQLTTEQICAAWPCAPRALDQWLVEVDLRRIG